MGAQIFEWMVTASSAIESVVMIGWVWVLIGVVAWYGVLRLAMSESGGSGDWHDKAIVGSLIGAVFGFVLPVILVILPFFLPIILVVVVLSMIGLLIGNSVHKGE